MSLVACLDNSNCMHRANLENCNLLGLHLLYTAKTCCTLHAMPYSSQAQAAWLLEQTIRVPCTGACITPAFGVCSCTALQLVLTLQELHLCNADHSSDIAFDSVVGALMVQC